MKPQPEAPRKAENGRGGGAHCDCPFTRSERDAIARCCLGAPSDVKPHELRFGTNGSKSVDLINGVYYDNEGKKGGGMLDLVCRTRGFPEQDYAAARKWLLDQGVISEPEESYIDETYDYTDEQGALLYQSVRLQFKRPDGSIVIGERDKAKKKFYQRKPGPEGGWINKLEGARRVLYRLPELLQALDEGKRILIPEGERKVNLLWQWGFAATCNAGGAKNWNDDFSGLMKGVDVFLLPDNDEAGLAHLNTVAASLTKAGVANVRVITLPGLGPKQDIVDWADAGGTPAQLLALIDEAKPYEPSSEETTRLRVAPSSPTKTVETIPLSSVVAKPIRWLWEGWLARAALCLMAGSPMDGKSTLALLMAAIVSRGGEWPDGTKAPRGSVLIWSGEDNLEQVIKPRLMRADADLDRIHAISAVTEGGKKRPFDPARDMKSLKAAIEKIGDVALIIIDPLVAVLPGKTDSHKNAEVRTALQALVDLAEAHDCAVLGIHHFTKGTRGSDPRDRITGSLAFGAVARIVLATAIKNKTTDDPDGPPRVITRAKSNIGKCGDGFGYDIEVGPLYENPEIIASRIVWRGPVQGYATDILNSVEGEGVAKRSAIDVAEEFLEEVLADGPRWADEVKKMAEERGIAEKTLKRAKENLRVHSRRVGGGGANGHWEWSLGELPF